jgi:hypothetical protein
MGETVGERRSGLVGRSSSVVGHLAFTLDIA